ncbi:hypothetical protein E9934_16975 [Nocardioides caeni]|uniref:Benzoate transporter n=1 Tax=Nocardioides caeni TaxID=574700 RepID=A0A4S8N0H1_9ACTN|nr:beta-propeller domain-containing protein [Nocardioides caeni]THV09260.1 hypothetical protein E9934_16975 [Nocardioides caeni]
MSDLEKMWDDYPAGKPPVDAILAKAGAGSAGGSGSAGGAGSARRRLVTRPVLTAAAATALVGAFVTGTLVAGGDGPGGDGGPGSGDLPQRVAFQADLAPAKSCDDLLETYVERALPLVSAWGWGNGVYDRLHLTGDVFLRDLATAAQSEAADGTALKSSYRAPTPQTDRQVNSDTGTNVQEAAVDEPDTVKTNGELLLTVRDDELATYDVTGDSTEQLSSLALPGIADAEIVLSGDTVVAIGVDDTGADASGTRVLGISIADPAEPEITSDVQYDAALVSARQHGADLRLVLSSGLPDLDFVAPGDKVSPAKAQRDNRTLVEDSTIEDWLPTITAGTPDEAGTAAQLLDCTEVAIPSDDLFVGTTSVVGFDAGTTGTVDAIGLAGEIGIAYESADHLYLATDGGWGSTMWPRCIDWCDMGSPTLDHSPSGVSHVFDFELDGITATHVASGKVEGSIRDRWSIDEADGILRVAVGPTSETGNFNSVVTLERSGQRLVEHGRLDNLGVNEDIKSVRWFDDLAIVVTFRRIDPLYAIDLTDTATPRLLGKLKIPGFSSYLNPLGELRMVGVGEGPNPDGRGWGAQIALFNVRDVTNVRQMNVHHYPRGSEARAAVDPRAFTWLPDQRIILTVVERWTGGRRVGYVSEVKVREGKLLERLVQVEYGNDVDHVRAVPMPDGRVVVVTGEDAEFFEL